MVGALLASLPKMLGGNKVTSFFTGLAVGLGLIVAIGAQNAWVLSMSIRGQHPRIIAAVCIVIDGLLMALGIATLGWLQQQLPALVPWMTGAGIALLLFLIAQNIRRVIRGSPGLLASGEVVLLPKGAVALQAAAISLLNPHVYLDTVVLIGSVGIAQPMPWLFWLGGVVASTLWFSCLAALGRPLGRWLKSPTRWRVFDSVISLFLAWVVFGLYRTL